MSKNKPLNQLNKEKLLLVAYIMQQIKDALDNKFTNDNYIELPPLGINDYMRVICDDYDHEVTEHDLNEEHVKHSKLKTFRYLYEEEVIAIGYESFIDDDGEYQTIESDFIIQIPGDEQSYPMRINLDNFNDYYKKVIKLAQPYLEKWRSEGTTSGELGRIEEVSLKLTGKTLWFCINEVPLLEVKTLKSTKSNNIKFYKELQRRKGRYLSKEEMGINAKSDVRHLPKTIGIKGPLLKHFIDIDDKNQKLKIPIKVELPHSEVEKLVAYVKDNFKP